MWPNHTTMEFPLCQEHHFGLFMYWNWCFIIYYSIQVIFASHVELMTSNFYVAVARCKTLFPIFCSLEFNCMLFQKLSDQWVSLSFSLVWLCELVPGLPCCMVVQGYGQICSYVVQQTYFAALLLFWLGSCVLEYLDINCAYYPIPTWFSM
jgi:hypothetical protein